MWKRILILLAILLVVEGMVIVTTPYLRSLFRFFYIPEIQESSEPNIATSSLDTFFGQRQEQAIIQVPPSLPATAPSGASPTAVANEPSAPKLQPAVKPQPPALAIPAVKEVSSKSLTELINSSVIQLYCGNMNPEKTEFSGISRGTGIIINSGGIVLTNRHIVYDEIFKKSKTDCFVLKSLFPNPAGEKQKIYYFAKIKNWPLEEKFSKSFSADKYYNDFALIEIDGKTTAENSKIGSMLGFNYAGPDDYKVLETNGRFNYLPTDWNYQPRVKDNLISAGYGTDASHEARQVTSSAGTITGNLVVISGNRTEMLIVEGNATAGFSGGALIHPQSKGFLGLVSWVSAGAEEGKFTVAIFRDFLSILIREEFNVDFKQLTTE